MISIENLRVHYQSGAGDVLAVDDVSLEVPAGEFFTLLGPSGCGKTTTLRCLAGLETPTSGRISIADRTVFSSEAGMAVPTHHRDIGMVFQSYAIWPHMTVFENVAFPLQEMRQRVPAQEIRRRVDEALKLVQLDGLQERPAPFLSGGQQQRLALARALIREAPVVLLDEPLSNLDAKLRAETRVELRKLVKRLGVTAIYVTHDQIEALTMSDRMAIMQAGRIVQLGSPVEVYQSPVSAFVASFIGRINFIDGTVGEHVAGPESFASVDTPWGTVNVDVPAGSGPGSRIVLAIRPENLRVSGERAASAERNTLNGEVVDVIFLGDALDCRLRSGTSILEFRLHPSSPVRVGDLLRVEADRGDFLVYRA